MLKINDIIVDRFCADSTEWQCTHSFDCFADNVLKIEHYGKNYVTDSVPDRYFELVRMHVNDVDLKHHLYNCRQTAYLPPWDTQHPPEQSLYLGHNGYLELRFSSPVNAWIQSLFGINNRTMHGQATTREVLADVKDFFGF